MDKEDDIVMILDKSEEITEKITTVLLWVGLISLVCFFVLAGLRLMMSYYVLGLFLVSCISIVPGFEKYLSKFLTKIYLRKYHHQLELKREKNMRDAYKDNSSLKKIICFHCLKSILLKDLVINCPFCDSVFSSHDNNVANVLLDKCPECDGKIRYVDCIYCGKSIDTFAPYDEHELEERRYG